MRPWKVKGRGTKGRPRETKLGGTSGIKPMAPQRKIPARPQLEREQGSATTENSGSGDLGPDTRGGRHQEADWEPSGAHKRHRGTSDVEPGTQDENGLDGNGQVGMGGNTDPSMTEEAPPPPIGEVRVRKRCRKACGCG